MHVKCRTFQKKKGEYPSLVSSKILESERGGHLNV